MTFNSQEIKEVHKREITGIRAGNGGRIPLSMCDRGGAVFSKVEPLGHGFMHRAIIKLRKNPKSTKVTEK